MILRVFTRSTYIQVPGVSCTGCLQKLILPRVEKIYVKNFISLQFSIMSINILIGWVPGKHVTKHLLYIFRLLTEICPVQVHKRFGFQLPSMDLNNPIYFRRQYTCTCNKNNRLCLFGVFRPIREFVSHYETSPLTAKGCKCLLWP